MSVPYDGTVMTATPGGATPGGTPRGGASPAGAGRPVLTAVLGAACISSSAILVTLAHVGDVTTAFFRCALALPLLVPLALLEQRRLGPRPLASRRNAVIAGLFLAVDLVLWNHAIADVGAGVATVLGNLQVLFVAAVRLAGAAGAAGQALPGDASRRAGRRRPRVRRAGRPRGRAASAARRRVRSRHVGRLRMLPADLAHHRRAHAARRRPASGRDGRGDCRRPSYSACCSAASSLPFRGRRSAGC